MTNLDHAQQQQVIQWIEQGLQPGDIQKRLAAELGVRLTYMELRFLLDDLKLKPKDKDVPPPPAPPATAPVPAPGAGPEDLDPLAPDAPGASRVAVTVDQITRVGALVSGKVKFGDGKSADWYLDQQGRLGLAPAEKGYKPSQADIIAFQTELQNQLSRLGL